METTLFHDSLTPAPWDGTATRRLPGMQPLDPADWLAPDAMFAPQMALRDALLADRPEAVIAEAIGPAGGELYRLAQAQIQTTGLTLHGDNALRADGVRVPLDPASPMATLARLTQSDLCLLELGPDGYRLTAAALLFPGGWTLSEKLGRGLTALHAPVADYDDTLAARVDRLFAALPPDRPLWRANATHEATPDLFNPRAEGTPRPPAPPDGGYLRSEFQTLRRLPQTGAVVFSILTRVLPVKGMDPRLRADWAAWAAG